ncbi:MAG: hypothetical protein ACKO1L_13430 [Brachymonas sp.]
MTTPQQDVQIGATFAKQAYTPTGALPAGWRVWTNQAIDGANASGSGFSGTVFVNDTTRQIVVGIAGTNDFKDVKSWPTVITGGQSSQFREAMSCIVCSCFDSVRQSLDARLLR